MWRWRWLLLLFLVNPSCVVPMVNHDSPGEDLAASKPRPNLLFPTWGGKQLWSDWRWRAGWRIQENVLTGHHRVLDPQDRRHAWGSWEACLTEFERLAPAAQEHGDGHLVVLLHGMGRGRSALAGLHQGLQEQGFTVAALTYPSTRRSIAEHVLQLESVLAHIEGFREVSFVTHSLGGVVVRELLAPARVPLSSQGESQAPTAAYWRTHLQARRIVMIAPPNQGSAFAQKMERFAPFAWIFGETGLSLTPQAMANVPVPAIPVLIIAGARGTDGAWNPWLESPNDGVVSVAETHLAGETDHLIVDNIHTFLMNDPATIAATARFLAGGCHFEDLDVRPAHD